MHLTMDIISDVSFRIKKIKEYMDAAIQSLTERGEYSTGWSKANKINLWARTENGEKAYKLLNNLIGGNSSGLQYNLFDSHAPVVENYEEWESCMAD